MTRLKRRNKQQRRGAAAGEVAIIAPLFFLLVLGSIEIGRAMMVQQVLTNASRVGAREATTPNSTFSTVESAAQTFAAGASVSQTTVSVTPDPGSAKAGDLMSVTVTTNFANVSWTPAPFFLGSTTLTATSVMRREGFE